MARALKNRGAKEKSTMTPLAKSIFVALSVAALIGGTLALRGKSAAAPAATLTPAQLTELKPSPRPEPERMAPHPVNDPSDLPPPPEDEPEVEDGNGS
jgi:hypothetical protein